MARVIGLLIFPYWDTFFLNKGDTILSIQDVVILSAIIAQTLEKSRIGATTSCELLHPQGDSLAYTPVNYLQFARKYPVLGIRSKEGIRKRVKKLLRAGFLKTPDHRPSGNLIYLQVHQDHLFKINGMQNHMAALVHQIDNGEFDSNI